MLDIEDSEYLEAIADLDGEGSADGMEYVEADIADLVGE